MDGRKRATLIIGIFLIILLLAPALDALAHGDLQEVRPAEGAERANAPREVMLTFTEAPTDDSVIRVFDGCQRDVVRDQIVEGRTKHVAIRAGRAVPGEWEVSYRVISAEDGHLTRGSYNFTVAGDTDCSEPAEPDEPDDPNEPDPGDDVAAPPPGADDGEGFPVVPVALGAGALIGAAALVRVFASRSGA